MKSKLLFFALTLTLLSEAAFAQDYSSRDRGRNKNREYYDNANDRSGTEYGPRRIRYDQDRNDWYAMPPKAFRKAMASISRENFDSDKTRMARFVASRNHLSTAQIRSIAQLLNFDSSKLEFTKYAYASCVDPENYYALGRIFAFSSSREELFDYMARV